LLGLLVGGNEVDVSNKEGCGEPWVPSSGVSVTVNTGIVPLPGRPVAVNKLDKVSRGVLVGDPGVSVANPEVGWIMIVVGLGVDVGVGDDEIIGIVIVEVGFVVAGGGAVGIVWWRVLAKPITDWKQSKRINVSMNDIKILSNWFFWIICIQIYFLLVFIPVWIILQ
jgi:hypothetical protein